MKQILLSPVLNHHTGAMPTHKIKYAAAVEKYELKRDLATRTLTPRLRENPGQVHAYKVPATRPAITEPQFTEDTWAYQAALCGKLIRVVLPLSFKATESNVCRRCAAKVEQLKSPALTRSERGDIEGYSNVWIPRRHRPRLPKSRAQQRPTVGNQATVKPWKQSQ